MEKVVVYGGSFNPPHNSHFALAEELINEMENVKKVLFMPVDTKYGKVGLINNEHRYNMLKIVCDKNPKFEVSDVELNRDRQLNTFETMEILKEEYQNCELIFATGSDNLTDLINWGYIDSLLSNYKIIVFKRGNDNIETIIDNDNFLKKYKNTFIQFNQKIITNLSSTYIRNKIKESKNVNFLIPQEIKNYIDDNNLYRS